MRLSKRKIEIAIADSLMKITEFSKKANLNFATVKKVLNGKEIKPETAGKIAKALNVSVEELMEE